MGRRATPDEHRNGFRDLDTHFAFDALVFLVIAVTVTPLCQRLKVSPIAGYLLAGVAVGPSALRLIDESEGTVMLGELGIVFLLFMIGLELSLDRLKVIRRFIFGLGSAQVAATGFILGTCLYAQGWADGIGAMVLGTALAFSSTAFVLHLLAERGELNTQGGRVAVAVLILQDLAVVPLLALLPLLKGGGSEALGWAMPIAILKASAAILVIFLAARLVLRPLFHLVAGSRSSEALVAAALLAVVGTAFATEQVGLSYSLGAFLAGTLLASSEYRHQVEADLHPVRGLLMGLFFLTVGMGIDTGEIWPRLHEVAFGLIGLLAIKALVVGALGLAFGFGATSALALGLLLAQGGEFSLVVLARAGEIGLVRQGSADLLTTIVALSMGATPLLAAAAGWLSRRHLLNTETVHTPGQESQDLAGHVILVGYGRVGRAIAAILESRGNAFIAIDRDPQTVIRARQNEKPVYFGDARKVEVLKALGALRARAVVLTIDSGSGREKIVPRLRHHFPDLRIVARAHDLPQARGLEALGAHAAVPVALEGSLQLAAETLHSLGHPEDDIRALIESYRRDDYARMEAEAGR